MNCKYIFIFLLAFSSMIDSCSESTTPSNKPRIINIYGDNQFPGDTMAISGEKFGYNNSNSKVLLNPGQVVMSYQCLKWNDNYIRFIIPSAARSGAMCVIINSDTSNIVDISIQDVPTVEMVEIRPDSFLMGSVNGLQPELPVHKVILTKAYDISKFEITQQVWNAVMGSNPSVYISKEYPTNNIIWMDAIRFCNNYSKLKGIKSYYIISNDTVTIDTTSDGYRLPTEAEWEYSCRAKSVGDFPSGGSLGDIAWFDDNSGFMPHFVGNKQPNTFGVYDILGNVWEWCWDWFDENYYNTSPEKDPTGPKTGTIHVLRGGSFLDGPTYCRTTNRSYPYSDFKLCGFRIARTKK